MCENCARAIIKHPLVAWLYVFMHVSFPVNPLNASPSSDFFPASAQHANTKAKQEPMTEKPWSNSRKLRWEWVWQNVAVALRR